MNSEEVDGQIVYMYVDYMNGRDSEQIECLYVDYVQGRE